MGPAVAGAQGILLRVAFPMGVPTIVDAVPGPGINNSVAQAPVGSASGVGSSIAIGNNSGSASRIPRDMPKRPGDGHSYAGKTASMDLCARSPLFSLSLFR